MCQRNFVRRLLFALAVSLVLVSAAQASPSEAVLQLIQSTFKLTNKDSKATSFLMSRPLPDKPGQQEQILVTAAHVLEHMSGTDATLVLRKLQPNGSYSRQDLPLKVRANGKPLWTRHKEMDIAVMRVQIPKEKA